MHYYGKNFTLLAICFIFFTIANLKISAQSGSGNFISERIPQIKRMSADINQNVLAMLTLIKEYQKYGTPPASKAARIIKPVVSVKETNNVNSLTLIEVKINEEFDIVDERDKWYKVKTLDNREGWLQEDEVQIITRQLTDSGTSAGAAVNQEASALLSQIARLKGTIDDIFSTATSLVTKTEGDYNKLSDDRKKTIEPDYRIFISHKEKIEKLYNYVIKFAGPYEAIMSGSGVPGVRKTVPGERFKGTISADIGRSSYNNMNSNSTTSRQLMFNGNFQIDNQTQANISLGHQNELMQTAFTNNIIEAGITKQFSDKMVLSSNIGYNIYDDKASDYNSFGLFRAGLNANFTPSDKTNLFGNASYQSKNFSDLGDNNYQGIMYGFGANLIIAPDKNIKLQMQGNSQMSEKAFFNFNQINPQILYSRKKSQGKIFSLGLDYDLLKFTADNNFSDYQRYKADFRWRNTMKNSALSRNLNFIYKQYPNNSKQDYFRLGYIFEKRKGSLRDEKSSISSFSYLFTIITQREDNFLTDYLDIRWNKSGTRKKSYSTLNIYTRLWNNALALSGDTAKYPDHIIDFYGEIGPFFRGSGDGSVKITGLKAGFVAGGHLFFNFDEDYILRNGNSVRGGFAVSGNIKIYKASLALAGSYERSLVLTKATAYDPFSGNLVYGDNIYRKPSSFQLNINYRQPIGNRWDVRFNLSTYEIRTDATFETSINPIERKSNLRFSGGLIYRFAL
jgi:hypothetical protein